MPKETHGKKSDKKQIKKKEQKNIYPYGKKSPEYVIAKRRRFLRDKDEIKTFIMRLIMLLVFLYILFGRIFGLALVDNDDMKPRISGGDLVLYYRIENNWHISDVAVLEKNGERYIGRIVAKGGDTVDIPDEGGLTINDANMVEDDIFYVTKKYEAGIEFPVTLKSDEWFVLCDYREGAKDSRFYGPVKMTEIKGRVIAVLRRSSL